MSRIAVTVLVLAASSPALAYETICREGAVPDLLAALQKSICDPPSAPACAPGPASARGRLLGEHVWLAAEALERAGLGALNAEPVSLAVWTDGAAAPDAGVPSIEPTGPGAMTKRVTRTHYLAEMAEVPDLSYSISDWLLGNEHCIATNALVPEAQGTPEGMVACHTFGSHMGSVNSTHFLPQAKALYELYHAHALQRAQRCEAMRAAFEGLTGHPAAAAVDAAVRACEDQALAFEVAAGHYLGDAWSVGHMWERWGSPQFGAIPYLRFKAQIVALMSGLVHGWRSIARRYLGDIPLQHDRLCMPGRFDPAAEEDVVQWRYPGQDAVHDGGGDLYLLACNAVDGDPARAVDTAEPLRFQKDRALTCLAQGLMEVYAAGPETRGPLAPVGPFDQAITGALDPLCWDQRATNRSMALGVGVTSIEGGMGDFRVLARLVPEVLPIAGVVSSDTGISKAEFDAAESLARKELLDLELRLLLRGVVDPDGTDAASGPNAHGEHAGGELMGSLGNAAYLDEITGDQVPYLERHDPDTWSTRPLAEACTADSQCQPGQYCDRGSVGPGGVGRHCVEHEAAVLRGFRQAELATWCTEHTDEDLDALAATCAAKGGEACDACAEVVVPLLRNACDEDSYTQYVALMAGTGTYAREADAVCDVLEGEGVARPGVQVRHRPHVGAQGQARQAAKGACQSPEGLARRVKPEGSVTYDMDEGPPATATPLGAYQPSLHYTCGATIGRAWQRVSASAADAGKEVTFRLTTHDIDLIGAAPYVQDATALSLDLFEGCGATPTATGTLRDADGAPGSERREVGWTVPPGGGDVCLRVSTAGSTTWASYELELIEGAPPVGGPAFTHLTAGGSYFCVRRSDGTVGCLGVNQAGQLGDGTTTDSTGLVTVKGLTDAVSVQAGSNFACALVEGGSLGCWGFNANGQLGGGGNVPWDTLTFAPVTGVTAYGVSQSGEHACAVSQGTTTCWGGPNGVGQLGDGQTGTGPGPVVAAVGGVTQIDPGNYHSCALAGGGVVCWGSNFYGCLGDGTDDPSPGPVSPLGVSGATSVAAGADRSCALTGGAVLCWGKDESGFTDDGYVPKPIPGVAGAVQLDVGSNHGCVVTSGGQVQCWGYNFYGQLGDKTTQDRTEAVTVEGIDDATHVATGGTFTAVLRSDGCVWTWGQQVPSQGSDFTPKQRVCPE